MFLTNIHDKLLTSVSNFKAGRIAHNESFWRTITSDRYILNTVKYGIAIEFDSLPTQEFIPKQYNMNKLEHQAVVTEIESLLNKGVIKVVDHCAGEFVSNVFVRPKKDGKFRMILNLCDLNLNVVYHKFKMTTLKSAVKLMTKNCFMASIDWKDAYYSVPIKSQHKKLLRFHFDNVLYEFQALPNGLASGPRIFTKLTKPLFSHLRKCGFLNSPYIDDVLILGDTKEECRENVVATVDVSTDCGFLVHPLKSELEPTQIIEFLGFVLNSVNMTIKVNERQATKIVDACSSLLKGGRYTIRQFAKVIGLLVASMPGVEMGQLYYRRLDNAKNLALKNNKGDFNSKIELDPVLTSDLEWWIDNIHSTYKLISHGNPTMTIYSDASLTGWGIACNGVKAGGRWSTEESKLHINVLELKAAWFGLRCFAKELTNVHIQLKIDNTTALAYIGNMGGRFDNLNDIARTIWLWCEQRHSGLHSFRR